MIEMIGLPPFQTREAKRFPILPIGLGSVANRRKGDSEYWRIYDYLYYTKFTG